jgi:hypothetical protein
VVDVVSDLRFLFLIVFVSSRAFLANHGPSTDPRSPSGEGFHLRESPPAVITNHRAAGPYSGSWGSSRQRTDASCASSLIALVPAVGSDMTNKRDSLDRRRRRSRNLRCAVRLTPPVRLRSQLPGLRPRGRTLPRASEVEAPFVPPQVAGPFTLPPPHIRHERPTSAWVAGSAKTVELRRKTGGTPQLQLTRRAAGIPLPSPSR